MNFDRELIEESVKNIIIGIGENPMREGLIETPTRVYKMLCECLEGIQYTNDEIVQLYNKCFEEDVDGFLHNGIVRIDDIECFSFCEHHLALIYDLKITVAYKPMNKVIGISKIARIAELICKRLQIQERITSDLLYVIEGITESKDIFIKVQGKHSCMTARGVKKSGAITTTTLGTGIYKNTYIT